MGDMIKVCCGIILLFIALLQIGQPFAFAGDPLPDASADGSPGVVAAPVPDLAALEMELMVRCRLHQAKAYPWAPDGFFAIGRLAMEYERLRERARSPGRADAATPATLDRPCLDLMNAAQAALAPAGDGPAILAVSRVTAAEPTNVAFAAPQLSPIAHTVSPVGLIADNERALPPSGATMVGGPASQAVAEAAVHPPRLNHAHAWRYKDPASGDIYEVRRVGPQPRHHGGAHGRSQRHARTAPRRPPVTRTAMPIVSRPPGQRVLEPVLEELPWPPRLSTSVWHPPVDPFADRQHYRTLSDTDGFLLERLHDAGFHEYGHFRIKDTGFAIVTKLERINDEGEPDAQSRFDSSYKHAGGFNWANYPVRLFFGIRGRYRLFVLIVTPEPILAAPGAPMEYQHGIELDRRGAGHLPLGMKQASMTANHKLSVLIYEFGYRDGDEHPKFLQDSGIDPAKHLEGAKLRLVP